MKLKTILKTKFFNLYEKIKSSLWIIPLLMGFFSFCLAIIFIEIDKRFVEASFIADIRIIFSGDAPTAVAILTVLVSSTATIVSLIISMTMVTFTLTSSEYGPRLLRNFISDRTNQIFIGFFISAFVYSITIVTHISSSDGSFFVPKLSVTFAILLSIVSIVVLMFFVNHIAESLRVESIVKNVSSELFVVMKRVFCSEDFVEATNHDDSSNIKFDYYCKSNASGYIQNINFQNLAEIAKKSSCVFKLLCRPGHFIHKDEAIISSTIKLEDELISSIQRSIDLGTFKTASQDVEYSIDQLVEIALVALSPGVNKTFTAIACIDRLCEAIAEATVLNISSKYIEIDGELTLIKYPLEFSDFVKASLDKIRQNSNIATSIHMINSLSSIISIAHDVNKKNFLITYSQRIYENIDRSNLHTSDIEDLEKSFKSCQV